jgi:hypothetical protein
MIVEESKLKNGRPYHIEEVYRVMKRTGWLRVVFEADNGSSIEWPVKFNGKANADKFIKLMNRISAPISESLKLHIMARERHGKR